MKEGATHLSLTFALVLFASTCGAQSSYKPQRPREGTKPPAIVEIRFTGVDAVWPPAPAGRLREIVLPQQTALPSTLTDELESTLISEAAQNPEVRRALGDKFALIGVEEDPTRLENSDQSDTSKSVIRYFSYSNNKEVKVHIRGSEIAGVESRDGTQPPAGVAELERGIIIVSADSRLTNKVRNLEAGGIVVAPNSKNHRILYVTFARRVGTPPLHWADVDLTDGKVLSVDQVIERPTLR